MNEQLALTGVASSLCGQQKVEAVDRLGRYRYVCTRCPHGPDVEHSYTWIPEPRRIDPIVTRGEVL